MGRRIGVLANGEEATGPKSSGLELAVVARSPPARTQYAPDSRAGEIAPIRSVDPRTTCAHVRLHRLFFGGGPRALYFFPSLSPCIATDTRSRRSLSRSSPRFSRWNWKGTKSVVKIRFHASVVAEGL